MIPSSFHSSHPCSPNLFKSVSFLAQFKVKTTNTSQKPKRVDQETRILGSFAFISAFMSLKFEVEQTQKLKQKLLPIIIFISQVLTLLVHRGPFKDF